MFAPLAPDVAGDMVQDRYELIAPIGSGAYGSVSQVLDRVTGEIVVIKKLLLTEKMGDGVPSHVIREVSLLRDFVHPNVVQLRGIFITGVSDYHLVFEYVEQDLYQVLRTHRKADEFLPMPLLVKYAQELMCGIHACHTRLIIHRDLKPQNILIGREGLKICDFGLARLFSLPSRPYTRGVMTLWYRAPEILLGQLMYGTEVDMWSIGCVLAEMATGAPLFPGDTEITTFFMMAKLLGTPDEETWPGIMFLEHYKRSFPKWRPTDLAPLAEARPELSQTALNLILGLLTMNPRARLSARKAKTHEFFREYAAHQPLENPGVMAAIWAGNGP